MISSKWIFVRSWIALLALGQGLGVVAYADFPTGSAIDSDLSGGTKMLDDKQISLQVEPDRIENGNESGPMNLQVLREDHGTLRPVLNLPIPSNVIEDCQRDPSRKVRVEFALKNTYFEISDGTDHYKFSADVMCHGANRFIFKSDSNGGQVMGIWQIADRGRTKLESEVGLQFWTHPVTFVWPGDADYYQMGQVNVTRGDHWDVVGHEFGHAIYDLGALGVFGGGQHKIDECYGVDLALSEGWASFFSGWLSVDLADPDAKFEFMVPRRAPIRFETVPSDVCRGVENEWRVTAFLWDLVDLHEDGEQSHLPFGTLWKAMKGSRAGSISEARDLMKKAGINPSLLQVIWDLNF